MQQMDAQIADLNEQEAADFFKNEVIKRIRHYKPAHLTLQAAAELIIQYLTRSHLIDFINPHFDAQKRKTIIDQCFSTSQPPGPSSMQEGQEAGHH